MLTREDFQRTIAESIARYPSLGPLYQTQDPRLLQHLDAMASMLALYAQQLEVATAEPFEKVRDATILADAAMRGLVPQAKPARAVARATNASATPITLEAGRALRDTAGRPWRVETPVEVPASGSATLEMAQAYAATMTHTVAGSRPFYAIEIPLADDDSWLSGLQVSDYLGAYTWRDRYTNVFADDRMFHVETDERQRVYVRFGQEGVFGVQPGDGAEITIHRLYSLGFIETLAPAMALSLASMQAPAEARLTLALESVITRGENPPSIELLRDLARYPATYNRNAVFLGEFDFLVRSHFPSLQWLSVWNEGVEERQRGMSLSNINTLFVAVLSGTGDETVLMQAPGAAAVAPVETLEANLTGTQRAIREAIWQADDSYKVRFYSPVRAPMQVTVEVAVASSFDEAAVHAQVRAVLLETYGESSPAVRRGQATPRYQTIYRLLRERVPALNVGQSDLTVDIAQCEGADRPELWRYIAPDTLDVRVNSGNVCIPFYGAGWGAGQ